MEELKRLKQIIGVILELKKLWKEIISCLPLLITYSFKDSILTLFPDKKLPDWFLIILGISLSINSELIFWVWSLRKKVKFKAKYGVYWDSELNPYCPICKTPLSLEKLPNQQEILYQTSPVYRMLKKPRLYCSKCDKYFSLISDSGISISLVDAKKNLKRCE